MFSDLSIITAIGLFVVYGAIDCLYAMWVYAIMNHTPLNAAAMAGSMHFLSAMGVLSYTKNTWYLLPIALGSFCGTY